MDRSNRVRAPFIGLAAGLLTVFASCSRGGAMNTATNEPFGIEGLTADDRSFSGSRFAEVREAMFANPYQKVWGAAGQAPFERFPVTLGSVLRGVLPFGGSWRFLDAAKRTVASNADLRWGPDRQGYRRLLHPTGIGLPGVCETTHGTPTTGPFPKRTPPA